MKKKLSLLPQACHLPGAPAVDQIDLAIYSRCTTRNDFFHTWDHDFDARRPEVEGAVVGRLVQGSGFKVQGSGGRVQGAGCRV